MNGGENDGGGEHPDTKSPRVDVGLAPQKVKPQARPEAEADDGQLDALADKLAALKKREAEAAAHDQASDDSDEGDEADES